MANALPHPRVVSSGRRRGSVVVIVVVSLLVLTGFAALVIDLGYVSMVEAQLQTATDAGSLAAARVLDGTDEGMATARANAVEVGAANDANGRPVVLDGNTEVELGKWSFSARTFTPTTDPLEVNAARVFTSSSDLTPMFSRVAFGRSTLGAAVESIAVTGPVTGAGAVPWYLPFGLPNCLFDSFDESQLQDMTFVFAPAGVDNTGWAAIGEATSASFLSDHFAAIGPCMEQWAADGTVESDCATAEVDDTVDLNNGATDSVLNYIGSHIGDDGIPWDTELWGTLPAQQANSDIPPSEYGSTYVGPIPVFSADPAYCTGSGGAWNETVPIDYFVWGVLYDVVRTGGSANKSVYLRIDLDSVYDVGSWPGGADDNHGVVAEAPSFLVR